MMGLSLYIHSNKKKISVNFLYWMKFITFLSAWKSKERNDKETGLTIKIQSKAPVAQLVTYKEKYFDEKN